MIEKEERNQLIYRQKRGIDTRVHTYRELSTMYEISIEALQHIVKREERRILEAQMNLNAEKETN